VCLLGVRYATVVQPSVSNVRSIKGCVHVSLRGKEKVSA
jgi:hypothetical protein